MLKSQKNEDIIKLRLSTAFSEQMELKIAIIWSNQGPATSFTKIIFRPKINLPCEAMKINGALWELVAVNASAFAGLHVHLLK